MQKQLIEFNLLGITHPFPVLSLLTSLELVLQQFQIFVKDTLYILINPTSISITYQVREGLEILHLGIQIITLPGIKKGKMKLYHSILISSAETTSIESFDSI